MSALGVAPEVLLWGDGTAALRGRIEGEYAALLAAAFARHCVAGAGASLRDLAIDTPQEAVARVVHAPRSVRRLLWPRAGEKRKAIAFLESSLHAERALLGIDGGPKASGWTADGRAFVSSRGAALVQPMLSTTAVSLDLRSPHARSIDLMGGSRITRPMRRVPAPEQEARVVDCIEAAWQGVRATAGSAADCVVAWTRVIVPQPDPSGLFWSGTSGEYVGRVMLVNAERESASVADVADALVHEAIHGFLYMHESVSPWVLDQALYTDKVAVVSPWSGTELPVRPFLQACFVWFGLATFWAQHVSREVFEQERVHYLLGRALAGFRGEALVDRLGEDRQRVVPELLDVVNELQRVVQSLLG